MREQGPLELLRLIGLFSLLISFVIAFVLVGLALVYVLQVRTRGEHRRDQHGEHS